jgi:crotonobetainyl-CoA:carnitine CoA-transferase CaiB-like acyl-CoA transferase
VFVTNARPSALRRWSLDYESLAATHPHLVMVHVTGFGRGGPASDRPGFGTIAEAMSGFAHLTGPADGPPTLPPFMLADGVASMAAASAVLAALYHRDARGGVGQLVDVSLVEPLARLIEPAMLAVDQFGVVPRRSGNRLDTGAPRNTYRTKDGEWLAMSSAAPAIAKRVFRAIGREDLVDRDDYVDPVRRRAHVDEIDALVADWVAQRTLDEALEALEVSGAAAGPVYDARQLMEDEHLKSRGTFVQLPDDDLGALTVQGPLAQLSATPAGVDHLGRSKGADNEEVYRGLLDLGSEQLDDLATRGVI